MSRGRTTPEELDDLTLARAQKGVAEARRRLVDRYQGPVFALLSRMLPGSNQRPLVHGELHGRSWVGHPGGVSGFNAQFMHFLRDDTFVLVMANTDVIDCREVAIAVAELTYGLQPAPHHEYEAVEVDPDVLDRYVGSYVLEQSEREKLEAAFTPTQLQWIQAVAIERRGERLRMINPVAFIEKWMYPAGEDLFFFKDSDQTLARFESSAEDRVVTRLYLRNAEIEIRLEKEP